MRRAPARQRSSVRGKVSSSTGGGHAGIRDRGGRSRSKCSTVPDSWDWVISHGRRFWAQKVGDIDQALDFYGKIFDFELRARSRAMRSSARGPIHQHGCKPPTHRRTGAGISGSSSTIVRVCARGSRPLPQGSRRSRTGQAPACRRSGRGGRICQYLVHQGAARIARDGLRPRQERKRAARAG
jgi:hypothetical protein